MIKALTKSHGQTGNKNVLATDSFLLFLFLVRNVYLMSWSLCVTGFFHLFNKALLSVQWVRNITCLGILMDNNTPYFQICSVISQITLLISEMYLSYWMCIIWGKKTCEIGLFQSFCAENKFLKMFLFTFFKRRITAYLSMISSRNFFFLTKRSQENPFEILLFKMNKLWSI